MSSMVETGAAVTLDSVTKDYGNDIIAVDAVDLTIAAGEFITLLGPSGSGKTTTLNMIAGFVTPSSGRIAVDGVVVNDVPPHKRNIGMVFQQYALFPHMTVAENVAYPLKQRKVPKTQARQMVEDALAMVRLETYADRLPKSLSGGQQQRVAVARASVFNPKLLLMDEPLGALDKKLREALQLEFRRIHRELGATIVFVTHDQEEALVMSDRIAVFNEGRIEQLGTASELYESPTTAFVANFLGESNVFRGDVQASQAGVTISGAFGTLRCRATDVNSGRGLAVVRPERMELGVSGTLDHAGDVQVNRVQGRVKEIIYLGSEQRILIDAGQENRFTAIATPDQRVEIDSTVTLTFRAQDTIALVDA